MRENRIKRQLQAGQTAIAVSGHHNADMIDFLGQFGFDGVWLEGEHGPVDWDAIGDLSRACDLWGMASVTRVNNNDPAPSCAPSTAAPWASWCRTSTPARPPSRP